MMNTGSDPRSGCVWQHALSFSRIRLQRSVLALLVALMGVANIASALVVRVMAREHLLRVLLPLQIVHGSRHAALLIGLALLLLSRSLWRGQHWAWLIAIGALVSSATVHLLKGLDWEEASAALILTGILFWQREAFRAGAHAPSYRRALGTLAWGLLIVCGYGVLGLLLVRGQFATPWSWRDAAGEMIARLLLSHGPLVPRTHRAAWLLESWSIFGVALLGYGLLALLRPWIAAPASAAERARARDLVQRYGRSSLAPFALTADKSLYFGQRVEGLIAYRVAGGVAVVCGDPLVADDCLAALLAEFEHYCLLQGWNLCCYEAGDRHLETYAALGLRALKIGEDAWIDVQRFTLQGRRIADVRHAVAKIERDGLQFQILDPALPDGQAGWWAQMQHLAATARRRSWQLQFSVGRLPAQPDRDARYALALGADGIVYGVCAWLPLPAINGWALDTMLRHPCAPNGTMEYLIAQSLLWLQRHGAAWASLGVAPLADAAIDSADERSLLQRGVRFLYHHPKLNELYRYQSLFFFKRKFVPQWRSVYLVYDSRLALPRIAYAVLKVHLPGIGLRLLGELLAARWQRRRAWRRAQRWHHGSATPSG